MDPSYVPLLSALAGAIIGSAASIATIIIQARLSDRRERIKQAGMMALEEYKMRVVHIRPGSPMMPLPLFVHYHLQMLDALENNTLTRARLHEIVAQNDELIKASIEAEGKAR